MNVKATLLSIASLLLAVSPWGLAAAADTPAGSAAAPPPTGVQASGNRTGDIRIAGSQGSSIQISGSQVSGSRVSSSVSGGHSSAEAVISGSNGVIAVQGERVEVKEGRLSLNGIPYGRVSPNSEVRFTIDNGEKRLFVDGEERGPEEE